MGIITSKCLWMISAAYTNDALEMNSINKCVQKVLDNIYKHRDISFEEIKKKGEWYENNEKASMLKLIPIRIIVKKEFIISPI